MPDVGHAAPPAYPPWSAHDWAPELLRRLKLASVLMASGARFYEVPGASRTVPRLLDDPDAADFVDPSEELPSDQVTGDSITLRPKKIGLVSALDIESIEDSDVATLDEVGAALARSVAQRIDNRALSTQAAGKGFVGTFGAMTAANRAVNVPGILRTLAEIQSRGGQPNIVWLNPLDYVEAKLAAACKRRASRSSCRSSGCSWALMCSTIASATWIR